MFSLLLNWVTVFLVWLSADPREMAMEDARASAAVATARAAVLDGPRRRDDEETPVDPAPEAVKPVPVPAVVPPCHSGNCPVR